MSEITVHIINAAESGGTEGGPAAIETLSCPYGIQASALLDRFNVPEH